MQVMNNTMNQNNTSAAAAMNHQPPRSFTFADDADHQAEEVTEANAVVVGEKNIIATTTSASSASGRSPRSRSPRVDCTNAFLNSSEDPQQQSVKQQQPTLAKNTALLLTPVTTTQTQPTTTTNIPNTIMNKNKNVGADDIHPLAMAAITMQQRKKSSQSNASHKWSATNGIGGWMEKTTKKNTLLSSSKGEQTTTITKNNNDTTTTIDSPQMNEQQIVYENSLSPEISELTPPTPPPTDTNTNNQIAKTSTSAAATTTMKKNKSSDNLGGSQTNNKNNNKLSTKQQIAMNNFLKAQTSGNPISKEEMWKELVRTMKQDIDYDHHHVHPSSSSYNRSNSGSSSNNNHRGRLNSKGGGGGSSNNKSWSTNKDDILGLIRIGGGMKIGGNASDVISIESGLTSEGFGGGTFAGFGGKSVKSANLEGWGEDGMWNPTPHGSPRKSESGGGGNNGGTVGNGALHMRSFTPPNVPVLSTKGDLPLVSPLSVDGSFDTNDVEGDGEGLDVPKELGLENSPFDSEKDKKYEKNVTPPENTFTKKHSKKKKEKSPCFFNLGESFADNAKKLWDTDDPTLSFADLSSGHDNDDNTASVSCAEKRRPTSSPPLLPMPRRSESPIVRSPSSAHQQQQYRKQGQSRSLMVQSVEGEVIPFHDMGKHQSLTREDEGTNNITSVFDAWATSNSQPPLLPDEPTMSPRKEPEEEVTPVRQSPTRSSKRRVKTPGQSLEAQILSVLQQQPESHVVDEAVDDDDDDVHDDKEEFDRSSPLPTAPTTSTKPKKKKKIKSGTVGSTASAQDILLELRSSTPCTLQSGNSSCNHNNRNDPPLGCISIGRGQQKQMVNKQQAVEKAQCPSSEESSNNKNNANKGVPTSATKALAPSRRDLPRPNRINRRSASEPTPVVPNQGAAVTTFVAKTSSVSSSQGSSTKTEIAANVLDNNSNKPPDNVKTESPHGYRKAIGINNKQVKSPVPPSRISRLFPNTHPASMKRRPTPIRSTNPFDSYPSTNPFDSPLRLKKEDPFDSQSSPIAMEVSGESLDVSCSLEIDASAAQRSASSGSVTTSSERAIAPPSSLSSRHDRLPPHPSSTLVLPPSRRDTTLKAGALQAAKSPRDSRLSPPTSPESSRSSPHNIDEIRASISQLKSNGVGGVGKSTSTLVRNEQTGRYVIQDIDDNHFEMMHTKEVENNEEDAEENSEEEGYVGVVETSMSSDESSYQVLTSQTKEPSSSLDNSARYKAQQSPIKFMMTNALMSESVLDDDAVDAAVQAAIDEEMSTASSSLNEDWTDTTEGNQEQPEQAHIQADTEEDDFFVIKRPQTGGEWGTKWSTFESSGKAFDNFDIQLSGSMDDWENDDDDFVNSDRQWENDGFVHSWGTEEKATQKEFFPSPTSVATNRRKIL